MFDAVVGQETAVHFLTATLKSGRTAHAYLYEGIEGCGKRTTALAFAAAILCTTGTACGECTPCCKLTNNHHPDLHFLEPDGAFIKIDQVRELQRILSLRPYEAQRKICIIEHADRLNQAAANAMLKTLEEPPGNALMILLTANPAGILPTIRSRCQGLRFVPLGQETIEAYLMDQGIGQNTAKIASSLAGGSLKTALDLATEGALEERSTILSRIVKLSGSGVQNLFAVAEDLSDKEKVRGVLAMLVSFFRDAMLSSCGCSSVVNSDLLLLVEAEARRFTLPAIMERIEWVEEAEQALQRNVNSRLTLEVLFMRLAGENLE